MDLHMPNCSLTGLLAQEVVTSMKEQKQPEPYLLYFFEVNNNAKKLFNEQKDDHFYMQSTEEKFN